MTHLLKYIATLIFIMLFVSCTDNPIQGSADNIYLADIFFNGSNNGWLVGSQGKIAYTTDAGANWYSVPSPTFQNLQAIWFNDNSNGFASGYGGTLLKTSNGGKNWNILNLNTTFTFNSIFFLPDKSVGWISGDSGCVFSSIDAGSTWKRLPNCPLYQTYNLEFTDQNNGFCCGKALNDSTASFYSSNDGGNTWIKTGDTIGEINTFHIYSKNLIIAAGSSRVFRSTNMGQSWEKKYDLRSIVPQTTAETNIFFGKISFLNDKTISISGFYGFNLGRIITSSDGGDSWSDTFLNTEKSGDPIHTLSLSYNTDGKLWSCGGFGYRLMSLSNGSTNWIQSIIK